HGAARQGGAGVPRRPARSGAEARDGTCTQPPVPEVARAAHPGLGRVGRTATRHTITWKGEERMSKGEESMSRGIRRLALAVLVGLSVTSLALAQPPREPQAEEAEDVLEAEHALATATVLATETLRVPEDTLRPQAIARTGFFSVYRDPTIAGHYCF